MNLIPLSIGLVTNSLSADRQGSTGFDSCFQVFRPQFYPQIRVRSEDLIKGGVIDQHWGKFFDEVFESRQRGDYMPIVIFEPAQVEEYLKQATQFVEEMKRLIRK